MFNNLNDLLNGIDDLSVSGNSTLRVSLNGDKLYKIMALTSIDGERGAQIIDIHLEEVFTKLN